MADKHVVTHGYKYSKRQVQVPKPQVQVQVPSSTSLVNDNTITYNNTKHLQCAITQNDGLNVSENVSQT